MNCNEAIEYIHSLEKFGIRPGLERIGELCRALGEPQKGLKIIHVAGTNGKGSTSTIISCILQKRDSIRDFLYRRMSRISERESSITAE